MLPFEPRVTLLLVRFFSADAANLHPISLIAPAQEGDTCQANTRAAVGVRGCPRSTASQQRCSLRRSVVARKRDGAVKTTRERAEEKRKAKLDLIREQVQNGALVIRQMTDEERRRYPPQSTPPKRPGRRY